MRIARHLRASLCFQFLHRLHDARNLCVYVRMFALHHCRGNICNSLCDVAIRSRTARLQQRSVCEHSMKDLSRIWTAIDGLRLQSANRYTTRSHANDSHIAHGTAWGAYAIMTNEEERWLRGRRHNETTATLCKRQCALQDRLV